ncbi:DUF5658 family protein [Pseudalkalibacillus caeni]|uniref:DUF5658 family protein n=1 Tax=Exobacillus caeni TaxID=2574798 RepID=UPI0026B1EB5C
MTISKIIESTRIKTIKYILVYLGILNLLDGILTYFGIQNFSIQELNPLMESLYKSSPLSFITLKLFLSILLFTIALKGKHPIRKPVSYLVYFAAFAYSIAFCLHSIWIFYLLV